MYSRDPVARIESALTSYPNLKELLGSLLLLRASATHPGCFLIDQLLLPNKPALEFLESVCTGYLGVVTDRGKAVEKIYDECKGQTKSSVDDFDGRLMDLLAKPAVVYLLYQKKMSRFRPYRPSTHTHPGLRV
jgi:hypothetical protein